MIYVRAINSDHIVEASLGYFINPLVAVLLGVFFLDEKLRRVQWVALAIALAGACYLVVTLGKLPWIGLSLALTFGFYSLLRKTAKLQSLEGLFLEMALLSVPWSFILFLYSSHGNSHFATSGLTIALFLIGTSIITTIPLLFFIFGAQRINMSTVGLLQYIAPTLQFLIGLLVYHEPFPLEKCVGFSIIWTALFLYSVDHISYAFQNIKLYNNFIIL